MHLYRLSIAALLLLIGAVPGYSAEVLSVGFGQFVSVLVVEGGIL